MPQQLITKGGMPRHNRPTLSVTEDMALALARVHELCGPARHTLAALIAAQTTGDVLWIAPAWWPARINGDGLFKIADPARFTFVHPTRPEDMLWSMEEALRSGVAPLVICELPEPPPLTPVRRLHLAAETGRELGKCRPLGLIVTAGQGGAAGVESRWSLAPAHQREDTPQWRLERLRDRTAPPAHWRLRRLGQRWTTRPEDQTQLRETA